MPNKIKINHTISVPSLYKHTHPNHRSNGIRHYKNSAYIAKETKINVQSTFIKKSKKIKASLENMEGNEFYDIIGFVMVI